MSYINKETFLQYIFTNKTWWSDKGISETNIDYMIDSIREITKNNLNYYKNEENYYTNEEKLNLIITAIKDSKKLNLFSKEFTEKIDNIGFTLEQYKDNPYCLKNYSIDNLYNSFYFLYKTVKIVLLKCHVAYKEKDKSIFKNRLSGIYNKDLDYLYSRLGTNIL
jgi:hypothetical protein